MLTNWLLLCVVVLACVKESMSIDCLKVHTSQGYVTLKHGQAACAPLLDGEIKGADEGKRFVICSYGRVVTQSCPGKLRYQVRYGICHWPEMGDCNIPGIRIDETQTTASTTTRSLKTTALTKTSLNITSPTASPTTDLPKTSSQTTASPTTDLPKTSSQTTASPTTSSRTALPKITSTQRATNAPTHVTKEDAHAAYTEKPTADTSNLSLKTTQNANNPSTGKDMQYTTSIPTTSHISIKPVTTTRIQKVSTTQNTANSKTSTEIRYTTKIPKASTTQNTANTKTRVETRYTTKIPIAPTTQNIANTQTRTNARYTTTNPRKSTTHITKTLATIATSTTPKLISASKTTALPVTSNPDLNSKTSTRAPSTSYPATPSSPSSTPDKGTPSDATDPSEYIDPCNWETCQLPQCFCYGAQPNISLQATPMFILLTFDGPMTSKLYKSYYEPIMVNNTYEFFNQNGCPFRSTVFLAGTDTDYSSVGTLATAGHEIASGTLTDTLPLEFSKDDYNDTVIEIDGLRKRVLQETKSEKLHDSIVGFRAPFLKTAHNVQFEVLRDNSFLYDSSISNIETYSARNPVWPYTMDFGVVQCPNPPCPSKNYSGLWEVPLNGWLGEDGQSCHYVDSCSVGAAGFFEPREEDWYNLFKNNFETYFYPAKAPMHISLRTSTPTENQPLEQEMVSWLEDTLSSYKDVWLVTHKMVIDWIRDPVTNSQMVAGKWGC